MPELPEVETVVRGLKPYLEGITVKSVIVRCQQLRWPIPVTLNEHLNQRVLMRIVRRGKYLLLKFDIGTLIIHLGMSGQLRVVTVDTPIKRHDHVDIIFSESVILRYNDPRRFGAILWTDRDPHDHSLIKSLGLEPLSISFTDQYLHEKAMGRSLAVKPFIMLNNVVVGIGNIYATEALFLARIHPATPAGKLTLKDCHLLVSSIQHTLQSAIAQGGTTLKDFVNAEGKPGYFSQLLNVYGKGGLPCPQCKTPLQTIVLGQRNTVFCGFCQKIHS